MIKRSIQIAGWTAMILGIYILAVKSNWIPSPAKFFRAAPVLIDETPVLVMEVRKISELVTITAMDEVVVSQVKPASYGNSNSILHLMNPLAPVQIDRLVLVVTGTVLAGTSLQQLNERQIFIQGDSVSMQIPAAQILQVSTNPSGTETFIEDGSWTADEVNQLKLKAGEQLKLRALEKGILHKADAQALKVMNNFLHALGYTKVRVVTSS